MPFDVNNKYWKDVAEFVSSNLKKGDIIIAPIEFEEIIGKNLIIDYSLLITFKTKINWLIIHKGMIEKIDIDAMKYANRNLIPVFANEVFVIFSTHKDLKKVDSNSSHLIAYYEKFKKFQKISNPVPSSKDYSSLTTSKIKELMNGRYEGEAYRYHCLGDKVRDDSLNESIIKLISPVKDKKILDMGCGIGGYIHFVKDYKEFTGIDLSDVAISESNKIFGNRPGVRYISMDATNLKFIDDYFDIIIAKEVIEHLPEPQRAIKEVFRVLKPGGLCVVSSPNSDSLHLRVNRILGYPDFKCSFDHIKEFTFQEAVEILVHEGFMIKDTAGIFLHPYWGIKGIDTQVRHMTDNDPRMIEILRDLGKRVGAEYAFIFIILAIKPGY